MKHGDKYLLVIRLQLSPQYLTSKSICSFDWFGYSICQKSGNKQWIILFFLKQLVDIQSKAIGNQTPTFRRVSLNALAMEQLNISAKRFEIFQQEFRGKLEITIFKLFQNIISRGFPMKHCDKYLLVIRLQLSPQYLTSKSICSFDWFG